jgi:hypothetical protein
MQEEVLALGLRLFPQKREKRPKGGWKDQTTFRPLSTDSYGIACDDNVRVIECDTREAVWLFHNRSAACSTLKHSGSIRSSRTT